MTKSKTRKKRDAEERRKKEAAAVSELASDPLAKSLNGNSSEFEAVNSGFLQTPAELPLAVSMHCPICGKDLLIYTLPHRPSLFCSLLS